MSTDNPELNHTERASYELPGLLQRLGDISTSTVLTVEQRHLADAARTHAHNQQVAIAAGIDTIGHLIYIAADSTERLDSGRLQHVGLLISHLAVQLDYAIDAEEEMNFLLAQGHEQQGGAV